MKLEYIIQGILLVTAVAVLAHAPLSFFMGIVIGCVLELVRYKLKSK